MPIIFKSPKRPVRSASALTLVLVKFNPEKYLPKLSQFRYQRCTVIDHVASGRVANYSCPQSFREQSDRYGGAQPAEPCHGHKDLIVEGLELSADEANRVAILAPEATMNIIKNYEVVKIPSDNPRDHRTLDRLTEPRLHYK